MRRNACCCTGHRAVAPADRAPLQTALLREVQALYARGVTALYAGGARAAGLEIIHLMTADPVQTALPGAE